MPFLVVLSSVILLELELFMTLLHGLWDSDNNHLSSHHHPLKEKVKKPKTKGAKADSVEKVTVAQLLPELKNTAYFALMTSLMVLYFNYIKKNFLTCLFRKAYYLPNPCFSWRWNTCCHVSQGT